MNNDELIKEAQEKFGVAQPVSQPPLREVVTTSI